jgi:hypothetical protein
MKMKIKFYKLKLLIIKFYKYNKTKQTRNKIKIKNKPLIYQILIKTKKTWMTLFYIQMKKFLNNKKIVLNLYKYHFLQFIK